MMIAVCVVLTTMVLPVLARQIMWKIEQRPPIELEQAVALAKAKLKARGNFYCVRASISKSFTDGDWALDMASEKDSTHVSVGSDKSVRVSDKGFDYL